MRLNVTQRVALSIIRLATEHGGDWNASIAIRNYPSMAPSVATCNSLVKLGLVEKVGDDPQNQIFVYIK